MSAWHVLGVSKIFPLTYFSCLSFWCHLVVDPFWCQPVPHLLSMALSPFLLPQGSLNVLAKGPHQIPGTVSRAGETKFKYKI